MFTRRSRLKQQTVRGRPHRPGAQRASPAAPDHRPTTMRIALYSHDALGLGHLRRNLAIARSLARAGASTLLVTGVREAAAFPAPDGVDYLTLPGYAKDATGAYRPRFLKTTTRRLAALRSDTMRAALDAFAPDAFIVDKHPLGLYDELVPALDALAAHGTRCVLGLRDVLDEPRRTAAEWAACGGEEAVRDRYAAVWVYGDPRVYDVVRECRLGEAVAERATYTGYLGTGRTLPADPAEGPGHATPPAGSTVDGARRAAEEVADGPIALCLVGGGEDGYALADAFSRADMPSGTHGVVVTGPMMPAAQRAQLRRQAGPAVQVLEFLPDPAPLMARADAVVAMGGYNTVCELLASRAPALIVPRVTPRTEQLIRAQRMAGRGLLDVLHPRRARPSAISAWLDPRRRPRRPVRGRIDLDGLRRLPTLLARALSDAPHAVPTLELADVR